MHKYAHRSLWHSVHGEQPPDACDGTSCVSDICFSYRPGLFHTSDIRKYIVRLGLFAVVSEIPFDLAMHDTLWYPGRRIFFTLTAGLFAIYAMDSRGPVGGWKVEIALAAALLAEFLRFDYGMAGVGVIVLFYLCEKDRRCMPAGCSDDKVVERTEEIRITDHILAGSRIWRSYS